MPLLQQDGGVGVLPFVTFDSLAIVSGLVMPLLQQDGGVWVLPFVTFDSLASLSRQVILKLEHVDESIMFDASCHQASIRRSAVLNSEIIDCAILMHVTLVGIKPGR